MAGEEGLEPSLPGPEPGVLPLDDSPTDKYYFNTEITVSQGFAENFFAPNLLPVPRKRYSTLFSRKKQAPGKSHNIDAFWISQRSIKKQTDPIALAQLAW